MITCALLASAVLGQVQSGGAAMVSRYQQGHIPVSLGIDPSLAQYRLNLKIHAADRGTVNFDRIVVKAAGNGESLPVALAQSDSWIWTDYDGGYDLAIPFALTSGPSVETVKFSVSIPSTAQVVTSNFDLVLSAPTTPPKVEAGTEVRILNAKSDIRLDPWSAGDARQRPYMETFRIAELSKAEGRTTTKAQTQDKSDWRLSWQGDLAESDSMQIVHRDDVSQAAAAQLVGSQAVLFGQEWTVSDVYRSWQPSQVPGSGSFDVFNAPYVQHPLIAVLKRGSDQYFLIYGRDEADLKERLPAP